MKVQKIEKDNVVIHITPRELALLLGGLDHLTDDPTISDSDFKNIFEFTRPDAEKVSNDCWAELKKSGIFE
jgi:hypothetical protein